MHAHYNTLQQTLAAQFTQLNTLGDEVLDNAIAMHAALVAQHNSDSYEDLDATQYIDNLLDSLNAAYDNDVMYIGDAHANVCYARKQLHEVLDAMQTNYDTGDLMIVQLAQAIIQRHYTVTQSLA